MGLFGRTKDQGPATIESASESLDEGRSAPATIWAYVFRGSDDLEVVGESNYQEALWTLCGGSEGDRIRHGIVAVLVPEPDNPHDSNAIAVQIEGSLVGYLPRDVAAEYLPGLKSLMERVDGYVALEA